MTPIEIRTELRRLLKRQDKTYKVMEERRKRIEVLKKQYDRLERERAAHEVDVKKIAASTSGTKKPKAVDKQSLGNLINRLSPEERAAVLTLLNKQ